MKEDCATADLVVHVSGFKWIHKSLPHYYHSHCQPDAVIASAFEVELNAIGAATMIRMRLSLMIPVSVQFSSSSSYSFWDDAKYCRICSP